MNDSMSDISPDLTVKSQLEHLFSEQFKPIHMELIDQSHLHSGHGKATHFKLILVSEIFHSLTLVKRHQLVYKTAEIFIGKPIHALTMHLFTSAEWQTDNRIEKSPACLGGSHADKPRII